MKKLTNKEQIFCTLHMTSGSHVDAYKGAYSTKNMKATSIKTEAWKVLQRKHIITRLEELRVLVEDENILTFKEIQKMLSERAKNDLDSNGLKAIDILNKMSGNYEADNKKEINVSVKFGSLNDYYEVKEIE